MKKTLKAVLAALLVVCLLLPLAACGNNATTETKLKIAIPNDTTNEARALLLLQDQGYIKLKDGAGITATILDIVENPKNIEFSEVEAAQLPNLLPDVDYAVINSNYAISAGLNPTKDALALEGSSSAYANILAVKEGNENEPLVKALIAALSSKQVADYITEKYDGSVVSVVETLAMAMMPTSITPLWPVRPSPLPLPPLPTLRSWLLPRKFWPPRTSPWISRSTATMLSPIML